MPGAVDRRPHLSVVVPCFNEVDRVPLLERAARELAERAPELRLEFVLVDDGSTDATVARLRGLEQVLEASYPDRVWVRVLECAANRGKGAALRAGVAVSRGNRVLTADADMATPLVQVLEWQRQGQVDLCGEPDAGGRILIASREHVHSVVEDWPGRRLMGRVFNVCVQAISNLFLSDTQCGFKLYPGPVARAVFAELRHRGWAHDVELLSLAQRAGYQIVSLPVRWKAVAKSKVRPGIDAIRMLWGLLRIRLSLYRRIDLGIGGASRLIERTRQERWFERGALAVFVVLVLTVLATFRDYGVSWDEDLHRRYGRAVFEYTTTLLSSEHSREAMHLGNLFRYGGLVDVSGYMLARLLPFGEFETRHLLNALIGLAGVLGAWKLARFLWGARAGALAAAFLTLMPTYYGHMFMNPKDIPFAAAYIWAVYYLVRSLAHFPAIPPGLMLKLGLALGATLSVRAGGLVVVSYFALAVAIFLLARAVRGRRVDLGEVATMLERFALVCLGAWAMMMAFWPYAFEAPVDALRNSLTYFSSFPFRGSILYDGQVLILPDVPTPRDYVPWLLAIQLPELVVVLAVVAVVVFLRALTSIRTWPQLQRSVPEGFILMTCLVPLLHVMAIRATLYDGLRHLTFVLPLIAVLAARAGDSIWARASRFKPPARHTVLVAVLAYAAWQITVMIQLHPYQYVYYNQLVGGLRGAQDRYDTDYWATSYKEATSGLAAVLAQESSARGSATGRPRVYVAGPKVPAEYYFPEGWESVGGLRSAQFVMTMTRAGMHTAYDAPVLVTVERMGVPLAYVFDWRARAEAGVLDEPEGSAPEDEVE